MCLVLEKYEGATLCYRLQLLRIKSKLGVIRIKLTYKVSHNDPQEEKMAVATCLKAAQEKQQVYWWMISAITSIFIIIISAVFLIVIVIVIVIIIREIWKGRLTSWRRGRLRHQSWLSQERIHTSSFGWWWWCLVMIRILTRAGKSKSLIRWKRLKGGKRRKKAEKANLIYD